MAYSRTLQHFTSSQELASIWASSQNYLLNQLVLNDDILYRATIDHTSSSTFTTDLGAGKWVAISSSAVSGVKNYISNSNFEDNTTTGWSLFNTTLTNKIPTGSITAGAASITSFAVDSTTPIAGTYDLRVASSGVLAAGQGFISDAFTIDREDQAKPLTFSFAYEKVSGTVDFSGTSNNTFAVYIYDVTGSTWIQPAGVYNLVQGSGVGIASGSFQSTATGTQYRIAVICVTATSGAVEMRFDDFQLGPQKVLAGAAVSDWVSYTPTPQGFTASAIEGKWRRVGDSVEVKARAVMSGTTGGAYSISAPFVVDSTKFPASLPNNFYGTGGYYDLNLNQGYIGTSFVTSGASPVIGVYGPAGSQWQVSTVPVGFGVGDIFTVDITYPVQGWSSNTVLSQDTDTRVVAASVYRSGANQSVSGSSDVKIQWNGKNNDSTASFDSATNYRWTNPVSGVIKGSGFIGINATAASAVILVNLYKNGSPVKTIGLMSSSASTSTSIPFSFQIELKAGEYLEMYVNPSGKPSQFKAIPQFLTDHNGISNAFPVPQRSPLVRQFHAFTRQTQQRL